MSKDVGARAVVVHITTSGYQQPKRLYILGFVDFGKELGVQIIS